MHNLFIKKKKSVWTFSYQLCMLYSILTGENQWLKITEDQWLFVNP